MNIGIIGAGAIGAAIARALSRSGIDASIANSRGPASLAGLVTELGPRIKAVTVREAAQADLLFLASDEREATGRVAELAGRLGFAAIDLGGLANGRLTQFPGGPLTALNLVKFG
jgi:hypothetical protein